MDETTLIPVKKLDVAVIFSDKGLDEILSEIERIAMAHVPDVTTDQGRSDIKSLAYKVARSKTVIDSFGKDVIADWKKKTDNINAYRKRARDFLDPLRDRVRKPLTDWEAEQERINAEKEAAEQARIQDMIDSLALVGCIMPFFDLATMTDEAFTVLYAEKKAAFEAEQARIAEEKRIEAERLEKERLEREAETKRLAIERAELDKIKAEQEAERKRLKEEQDKIDAEKRKAERIAFEKQALENARIAAEKATKEKADREAAEKAAAEAKAKDEAERAEKLRPDREKLLSFANSLLEIRAPEVSDTRAQGVADTAIAEIYRIANRIIKQSKDL